MGFPISAGLLDSMVLSVVDREDTYGYEITQFIRSAVDVSESTLYPVLKRLQKASCLKPTIRNIWAGTDVIITLPQREKKLLKNTAESGRSIRIW